MTIALGARGVRGVVLDIEGTTTPVSFVYEVLFPYARAHVSTWLGAYLHTSEGRDVEEVLRADWEAEGAHGDAPPALEDAPPGERLASLARFVTWSMDRDRKTSGLKALQGKIWEMGYRSGTLHGDVFRDVPPALRRWRNAGLRIAIYSSGSVLAQQLLFATTPWGDLTPLIDSYFDTRVGAKQSQESYRRIATALGIASEALIFISDVVDELRAAHEAGFQALLCIRDEGTAPSSQPDVVHTFDEIAS